MEELRNCPFCGKRECLISAISANGRHYVRCGFCGGEITGNTEDKAIAAWNKRVE